MLVSGHGVRKGKRQGPIVFSTIKESDKRMLVNGHGVRKGKRQGPIVFSQIKESDALRETYEFGVTE